VRRMLLLTALSLVGALVLAPAVFAQDESASPSPSPDEIIAQEGPPLTALTPTATASGRPAAAAGGTLPDTGGNGLALVAGALLLGSGVLSYAVLRRR
jgi:LPXTG-motif cell wall-anchored protein